MRRLARAAMDRVRKGLRSETPLAQPDPAYVPAPRPMVGLFGSLSEAQRRYVLDYKGEENHGDLSFKVGGPSCP